MKKAIAMKCTQEQWDSIKDRIPEEMIHDNLFSLIDYPYLTNNYNSQNRKGIGTHPKSYIKKGVEIHETFNAKVFLDACGIKTDVYEITKEQVLEMSYWGNSRDIEKVKQWFPDAFKKDLEVGKWYIRKNNKKCLICYDGGESGYGFGYAGFWGNWLMNENNINDFTEATTQEVESALISEAKKRGYKENIIIKGLGNTQDGRFHYRSDINYLYCGSYAIFQNGQWATIIQPEKMTLEQIEKELGRKIEIV